MFGAYVSDSATGEVQRTAIDVVAADGSDRRRLTTRPGLVDDGMSWSPDSRYLAYLGLADGPGTPAADLYVIGVDGSGERQLTETPATEHHPEWSPDGAFLAFETSSEGLADRLTTIKMDGAAPLDLPSLGPESEWFVWSPEGRQLLWQEVTTVASESFRTTLHSIDREFRQPSTTLQVVDGLIVCPPSWQRLDR